MSIHRPHWFSEDHVMVSTAPTCGLTKGGRMLRKVDDHARPIQVVDPETGALVDAVNDQLLEDMEALTRISSVEAAVEGGELPETLAFVPAADVDLGVAVPAYYDRRFHTHFLEAMQTPEFDGFTSSTLGEMVETGKIVLRGGHGSPSQEQRIGDVPYIKVSDLRAGLVNINPTNRVPRAIAERLWGGSSSGLQAFDLLCPERTSKNIGDFCVLMPGQEQVLTTKEVIVLRPGPEADFDAFYLLWAMTLKIVRDQWKRIVFMQTNREDVGKRYLEVEIPVAPSSEKAAEVSQEFRNYFQTLANARNQLETYLASSDNHHFFVSGAESLQEEAEAEAGGPAEPRLSEMVDEDSNQ